MSHEQDLTDAARVKEILNDEVFQAAIAATAGKYTAAWENGKTPDDRERAWFMFRALKDVIVELGITSGRGDLARHALDLAARHAAR